MRVHGELLLTGSNDQSVSIIQSNTLTVINRIDCGKLLSSSICCSIRAVDAKDNRILIGTLGSEIFELKSNQKIENATNDG